MADTPIMTENFNEDLDIAERLAEGGVLSRIFIEVQATDENAAKTAMEKTIFDKLKNEKTLDILEANLYDILKDPDKDYFSGVAEVKLVARDFRSFVNAVMRYAPSAIEIQEPEEIHLSNDEMHSLVADISEITQMYSTQVMSMMRDPERYALYQKMLAREEEEGGQAT